MGLTTEDDFKDLLTIAELVLFHYDPEGLQPPMPLAFDHAMSMLDAFVTRFEDY